MKYEWDDTKAISNLEKHGVDFGVAVDFDWSFALEQQDSRKDYQEIRWIAYAPIHQRLYVMVYTPRGDSIRIISLRKANSREVQAYEAAFD